MDTRNPFFDVHRVPVFGEIDNPEGPYRVDLGKDALINAETMDPVGMVSRNYVLVENQDVVGLFDEAFGNLKIQEIRDHLNPSGSKFIRDIILDEDKYSADITNRGDVVKTKIRLWNGYDGRTAVGFTVGAWRQICSNGMMGWADIYCRTYQHMSTGLIDQIRNEFELNFSRFGSNFELWGNWAALPFGQSDFNTFIDFHTKGKGLSPERVQYLSEKQAEGIKGLYEPIMNEFGEDETRWGAFNVLTAIATHHTKARKGSNLFSQGHRRMERLSEDFYSFNPEDLPRVAA